jgi:uncharacterized protein (TIGR03435 family)
MSLTTTATLSVFFVAASVLVLDAQVPPPTQALAFEVASIKPNRSGDFRRAIGPGPGGFSAMNSSLRELVAMAFGVSQSFAAINVVGGPSWIDSERFDIDAKTGVERLPFDQISQMLRALLVERFQLKAHQETRERDVYALVLADANRGTGPRLKSATYDCAARFAALARKETPEPLPPPGPDGRRACSGQVRPGSLFTTGLQIDFLADGLAPFVNRVVLDRTGLKGGFNLDLEWTPEQAGPPRPDVPSPPIDPNGPSIFTALREQLGLKLESAKAPVEVVVIDSAERPTPN